MHKYSWPLLEIRESQDLAKDFGKLARSWKGNKAREKIYKFKKFELYKETKQTYNNYEED